VRCVYYTVWPLVDATFVRIRHRSVSGSHRLYIQGPNHRSFRS